MPDFIVDLDNCELEPIHIPGQIQSHGFLLVVDNDSTIKFISENVTSFLYTPASSLLNKPLSDFEALINNQMQPEFITELLSFGKSGQKFDQTNPFEFEISGFPFYLVISRSDEYYLLEIEPAGSTVTLDIQNQIGRSIAGMLGDKSLKNLLNNAAEQVQHIIHFDRVMIYRFAEDGHGEVVAEARKEHLTSWMGLHYPASDIPQQARDLYKLNLTRLIANVEEIPSKIIAVSDHKLDLTHSQLRAVSPIHIQYLKNMGVASSFSISLLYKGELWGLIACHNYTPQFIDFKSRESAKLIGQILSSALEFRQDEETQQLKDNYSQGLDKLSRYLNQSESIEEALTQHPVNLLNIVNATGAVLFYNQKATKLGITPDDSQLKNLLHWAHDHVTEPVYQTDSLSSVYSEAASYTGTASGMVICVLSKELREYLIWFKPELIQTINWAGNPEKPFEYSDNGMMQISPRHSFEVWSQTVAGKSEKWSHEEIRSIRQLREEIAYVTMLKADAVRAMNEKLRLAYEELDTFSYTISHDLKNPLAMIKSYTQLLTRDQTIGHQGMNFLTRIGNGADRMNSMITEVLDYSRIGRSELQYRPVDIRSILLDITEDLKAIYSFADLDITIGDTPEVQGDKTMLFQVFSNLIGNAVKYSRYAQRKEVSVQGEIDGNEVCYRITDNGIGIDPKDHSKLFDLFRRMDNVKDIEGSGVGLAIVKRIVDKHDGRIWVESVAGKGSTFYVAFKRYHSFQLQPGFD
jgi:chemotaxis family two-component system sensor kinase Cph1